MSGHKRATVTARTENLRALSQTEMSVRFVEAGLTDLSRRMDHLAQQQSSLEAQEMQSINQELVQALSSIDEVFGQLEDETHISLLDQQQQFFTHLQQLSDQVELTNADQIEQLNDQYQALVAEMAAQQQSSITQFTSKLEQLMQEHHSLDHDAQKWITAAETLFETMVNDPVLVNENMDYMLHFTDLINQANDNYQAGYKEAALASAQFAYREFSQARLKSHQLSSQFSAMSRILNNKLDLLDHEIDLNLQVHVIDLQGNPLDMEIWVDDWVGGKLAQLKQEIINTRTLINQPASRVVLRKMRHLLKHTLPQWRALLSELVYMARSEVINSQLRMNIALMVVKALTIQGYRLEESSYEHEDMRAGYRAQMEDLEGSQVRIFVEGKDGSPETTELNLFTQDVDRRTPHELRQRSFEIKRALNRAGLEVGPITAVETGSSQPVFSQEKVEHHQEKNITIQVQDER